MVGTTAHPSLRLGCSYLNWRHQVRQANLNAHLTVKIKLLLERHSHLLGNKPLLGGE